MVGCNLANSAKYGSARSWLERLALRWVVLYFLFYVFLDITVGNFWASLPGLNFLTGPANAQVSLWKAIVPWVSVHLVGHPIATNTFGDTVFTYSEIGLIAILAFAMAVAWVCLDRNRERERKLYDATRILLCYFLAVVLWQYGFTKLLPCGFFPCPEGATLMQPFGSMTSDNLMWFFFGYSFPYSVLIGIAEMSGGIFVLFRRTRALGALILVGVLANVALLNIFYNVGVRLFSANLTFMALFLFAPEARRIVNAILGYALPETPLEGTKPKGWSVAGSIIAKVLFTGWVLFCNVPFWVQAMNAREAGLRRPMVGYYQVDGFQRYKPTRSSFKTEKSLWKSLVIEGNAGSNIYAQPRIAPHYTAYARTADGTLKTYFLEIKQNTSTRGLFNLTPCYGPYYFCPFLNTPETHSRLTTLRYSRIPHADNRGQGPAGTDSLVLDGTIDGAEILMRLHRLSRSPFLLEQTHIHLVDP